MSNVRSRLPPSFSVTVGMWTICAALYQGRIVRAVVPLRAAVLSPAEFFSVLRKSLKSRLPPQLRTFESGRGHGRLLKFHYGHPEFHYEVWHHTGAGRLEVGLHFEGGVELNQRAFDFFRDRIVEVKAQLPHAELEPWDRGWSRLYETLAAAQLDDALAHQTAARLAEYVITLQPLVETFWKRSG